MAKVVLAYGEWPWTTGEFMARAFRKRGHEVHILPLQQYRRGRVNKVFRYLERDVPFFSWVDAKKWIRKSRIDPDLFVWIESPRFVEVKIDQAFPCPTAAWIIDTAIQPDRLKFLGRQYEHVFVSQFEAVSEFTEAGLATSWLPVAADPEIHAPANVREEYDIGFVGNLTSPAYKQRVSLLRALRERYRVLVTQAYGPDMAVEYSRCRLGFNIGQRRGLNMRVFEVMGIGRPLVTDTFANGIDQLFKDGIHYAGYSDERSLFAQVDSLLADSSRATDLANNAREEVLAKHTYVHRAESIIQQLLRPTDVSDPPRIAS